MRCISTMYRFSYFCLVALAFSCNSAPQGFYAPVGSTVELPADQNYQIGQGQSILVLLSGNVKVPFSGGGDEDENIPGNNIFVELNCVNCTMYVADGVDTAATTPEEQLVSVGKSYGLTTNSKGNFTVLVSLVSPQDLVSGSVASYEAKLQASLGVAVDDVLYKVSLPGSGA